MTKFDFNDILIQPAELSSINSRTEINPYRDNLGGQPRLPIITAPMDTVVSSKNHKLFLDNNVNVCLPRHEYGSSPPTNAFNGVFLSYSIEDFTKKFLKPHSLPGDCKKYEGNGMFFVLIDVANGHMESLLKATKKAKDRYGESMFLMVGNVANAKTYSLLSDAGADAVRVGIGGGQGCLTTVQTAVGYPMASLIHECYQEKFSDNKKALIIADGGMKGYSDIIKALALGADYVMVGSIFNKALESCGPTYLLNKFEIDPEGKLAKWCFNNKIKLTKKFRGMSTKEVQKKWGNKILKTSEGIVTYRPVEYTLKGWVENFEHYLRSAMSYSNAKTLDEFVKNVNLNRITTNAFARFDK